MNWQEKIIEYIESTKDFMLENAPSFFTEITAYGRATSVVVLFFAPIAFFISTYIAYKQFIIPIFDNHGDLLKGAGGTVFLRVVCSVVCIFLFISFFVQLDDSLMCWFAPRLYILKKITGK